MEKKTLLFRTAPHPPIHRTARTSSTVPGERDLREAIVTAMNLHLGIRAGRRTHASVGRGMTVVSATVFNGHPIDTTHTSV